MKLTPLLQPGDVGETEEIHKTTIEISTYTPINHEDKDKILSMITYIVDEGIYLDQIASLVYYSNESIETAELINACLVCCDIISKAREDKMKSAIVDSFCNCGYILPSALKLYRLEDHKPGCAYRVHIVELYEG